MAARFQIILARLTLFAIFLLSAAIIASCGAGGTFAGSGLVSTVGGATFIQGAGQFWVTSSRPTFSGVTTAGSAVSGTVGSESVSATADASGNWSWTPTADLSGDNQVSITSGSSTSTFTLTIGDVPESIASSSANTLAPAGSLDPTILALVGGTIAVTIGALGYKSSLKRS